MLILQPQPRNQVVQPFPLLTLFRIINRCPCFLFQIPLRVPKKNSFRALKFELVFLIGHAIKQLWTMFSKKPGTATEAKLENRVNESLELFFLGTKRATVFGFLHTGSTSPTFTAAVRDPEQTQNKTRPL